MKTIFRTVAASIALILPLFSLAAGSQTASIAPEQRVSADYRFERFELDSRDDDRGYIVEIAIPKATPRASGFRAIYMLDGRRAFALIEAPMLHRLAGSDDPPVLVAVGHAGARDLQVLARAFDYTPPDAQGEPTRDPAGRPAGGESAFRSLLIDAIIPRVHHIVHIDTRRQTLWGHSYGGLFALRMALSGNSPFTEVVAASPSLWWDGGSAFRDAQELAANHRPALPDLSIMVETPRVSDRSNGERDRIGRGSVPADAARILADQLGASRHPVRYLECSGQTHGSMFLLSLRHTLWRSGDADANSECTTRQMGQIHRSR